MTQEENAKLRSEPFECQPCSCTTNGSVKQKGRRPAYPACIGIQKPPPHTILQHFSHAPTSVQEDGQHALAQLNNARIFLRLCGLRRIVGHRVLLRDRRDDEGRMEVDQRSPQRVELGVPPADFNTLDLNKSALA